MGVVWDVFQCWRQKHEAKRFSNTMRYIDDLLTLNNTLFHSAIDDIYPEELKLKETSESSITLSYLDIYTNNYSAMCRSFDAHYNNCKWMDLA